MHSVLNLPVRFGEIFLQYAIDDRLKGGRWSLGCVKPASWLPLAVEGKFTQPRAHLLADPCTVAARQAIGSRAAAT